MSKGRVSPRRASVLAYITNQLLHSHCVVVKEEKEADNQPQQFIFDLPRPKRDEIVDPETAFYESMDKYNTSAKGAPPAEHDPYDGYTPDMDKSK